MCVDTTVDKVLRFGCAAMLAPLSIIAVVWLGILESMNTSGLFVVTLVVAVIFGMLGVLLRERFIVGVLKVLKVLE